MCWRELLPIRRRKLQDRNKTSPLTGFAEPRPPRGSFLFYIHSSCAYFYQMCRSVFITLSFFLLVSICWSQVRLNKLVIEAKEKYQILGTDIMVLDTLVMNDSSSIILNPSKLDNFIHLKKIASFGKACMIFGHGISGIPGKQEDDGLTQSATFRNGSAGKEAFSAEH